MNSKNEQTPSLLGFDPACLPRSYRGIHRGFIGDVSGPVGAVSNRTGADLACPDSSGSSERDSINRDLERLINSKAHYLIAATLTALKLDPKMGTPFL